MFIVQSEKYYIHIIRQTKYGMKTVYFVRHAKSSWENPGLRDRDRPLSKRGKRDAPFMAKLLKGRGIQPEKIISSPANRALTTATYFAETFGFTQSEILVIDRLYEAHAEEVMDVVKKLQDDWHTVLVFGHNPTFTEVANLFAQKIIANIPTCGIVRVDDPVENWANFGSGKARLVEFHYPKQYFD